MKFLFVGSGYEGLGIEYLSAALKKAGHSTVLVYDPTPSGVNAKKLKTSKVLSMLFDWQDIVIANIIKQNPDVIGFTVLSDDYPWALKIATAIKEVKDIPIIFGGIHPTSNPREVLLEQCVDFVCVGEGEEALPLFVNALAKKQSLSGIANIWYKDSEHNIKENKISPVITDLDSLPAPDKDLYYDVYPDFIRSGYWLMSGRRCLYSCTYCYNSYLKKFYGKGKYYTRRSVDNIILELQEALRKYKIKSVFFHDDIFMHDMEWLKDFCKKYKEHINLPFHCEVHPIIIRNLEETVSLLSLANCTSIGMGVQTLDENVRKDILHRDYKNEDVSTIIKAFHKTQIYTGIDVIAGLPTEDDQSLLAAAKFINEVKPDFVFVPWLRFYPKTEIIDIALAKGVIDKKLYDEATLSKNSARVTDGGSTFRKSGARITNFMMLAAWLPAPLFKMFEKFRLYKALPVFNLYPLHQIFMFLWCKVFRGKRGPMFCSLVERLFYIIYFITKKFKRVNS